MARTADDNSIPQGDRWPLLSDLLVFVTKCLRSEVAAKRFLLDYFEKYPIEWRYEYTAEAPRSTLPPERWKGGLEPIPLHMPEAAAIYHCFWQSPKEWFNVDWEASSVSYDGPLIKVTRHSEHPAHSEHEHSEHLEHPNGRDDTFYVPSFVPFFDGFWRVKIDITLIRINAVPIVARLRSLGLLPADVVAPTPFASAAPPFETARAQSAQLASPKSSPTPENPANADTELWDAKEWMAQEIAVGRIELPSSKERARRGWTKDFAGELAKRASADRHVKGKPTQHAFENYLTTTKVLAKIQERAEEIKRATRPVRRRD